VHLPIVTCSKQTATTLPRSLSCKKKKKKKTPTKTTQAKCRSSKREKPKERKTSKCAAAEKQTFPPLYQSQFPIRPSLSLSLSLSPSLSHTHTHTQVTHPANRTTSTAKSLFPLGCYDHS